MLKRAPTASRRGVTLVELLVTMTVGGVALSLVAAVCLRQQRIISDLSYSTALSAQLRDAAAILPIDLRALSSALGDIRDARDTSIEVRATIASAVVCDTARAGVSLAPSGNGSVAFSGGLTTIEPGDSAWLLTLDDSSETWRPLRVVDVFAGPVGNCGALGPELGSRRASSRVGLVLDSAALATWIGRPMRITRPVRYSLYRGGDGAWWLGERDWNSVIARFNTIQPVAGPFLSPAARGLHLAFFDSAGSSVATPVVDTRAVATIRIELRGQPKVAPRRVGPVVDSLSMWVHLRNRR